VLHHGKGGASPSSPPAKCPPARVSSHARLPPNKHSKQPIKINNKASINGNGRQVVMNVLHPGSNVSTNPNSSNAAFQLYINTTTKKQNGGGAAVNMEKKLLQKTIKNDKVKGAAAVQTRGGVGSGGKAVTNMTSSNKNAAIGTSSSNNSSSNTHTTGSKNTTAMATAKLIVSAGSHPRNADIKQVRFGIKGAERGRGRGRLN
jgi:hypothetical protein